MIETKLDVKECCHYCTAFSPEYSHTEYYSMDKTYLHSITISCEHRSVCDYLLNYLLEHRTEDENNESK